MNTRTTPRSNFNNQRDILGESPVRHVERHHHERYPAAKDVGRGLWIDVDVELGRWRAVATLEKASTHQHAPSIPVSPCTYSAVTNGRDIGPGQPG